jgi:hypothetical protein
MEPKKGTQKGVSGWNQKRGPKSGCSGSGVVKESPASMERDSDTLPRPPCLPAVVRLPVAGRLSPCCLVDP